MSYLIRIWIKRRGIEGHDKIKKIKSRQSNIKNQMCHCIKHISHCQWNDRGILRETIMQHVQKTIQRIYSEIHINKHFEKNKLDDKLRINQNIANEFG